MYIFYIIQCAARITRHRAFSFLICIVTDIFSNLFQDLLSKNIENKSATNQPAVMFAVNITWYRCVQRYPVARYTNGTRTQGCQVMFTAKITANHIPKYKRPISFLSFLMDLLSIFVKKYMSLSLLFANKSYIFRIWPAVIFAVNITWYIWVCVPGKDYGGNHCRQ